MLIIPMAPETLGYPVDILFLSNSFYLIDFRQRYESFKYSSDGSQQSKIAFTSDDGGLWGGASPSSIVQFKNEIFVVTGGTDQDLFTFDLTFHEKIKKSTYKEWKRGVGLLQLSSQTIFFTLFRGT